VGFALPVVSVVVYQRVLAGGLDPQYFTSTSSDESGTVTSEMTPGITFWDRWTLASYVVPSERALVAATALWGAGAGLPLAAGGRWSLPRPSRWLAAAGGALSVLVALAVLAVTVAASQRTPEDNAYFSQSTSLLEVVQPVSAMVTVAVFGAVAVVVLLGSPLPPAPAAPEAVVEDPVPPLARDVRTAPVEPVGPTQPEPARVEEPVEVPVAFPRPSEADYARYRRPGA
jgi:hypothetical protein